LAVRNTAAGHDVTWAGHWNDDPGDHEILSRADAEGTLDKDFGELAILDERLTLASCHSPVCVRRRYWPSLAPPRT
jgi:hypothetical protein